MALNAFGGAALGTAVLELTTDDRKLEKGLGEAEKKGKGFGSKIGGIAKIAAVGLAGVGAAAIGAAFKTASLGDEIAKTATKMGISTDALQEMRFWADRNGLAHSDLERAVGRLNQRIGLAEQGNKKYTEAFEMLGISIHDTEGNIRSTEDVMRDTIAALRDIEDPALRSAAASELLGTKMARELMPTLEDGATSLEEATEKAHELGLVMDEEATKSAEKFSDQWGDISSSVQGFLRDAAIPVMGFMSDTLFPLIQGAIIPLLKRFAEWAGPKVKAAFEIAQDVMAPVMTFLSGTLFPTIGRAIEIYGELFGVITGTAPDAGAALTDALGRERAEAIMSALASVREFVKEVFEEAIPEAIAATQQVLEDLRPALETTRDLLAFMAEITMPVVSEAFEHWASVLGGIGDDMRDFAQFVRDAHQALSDLSALIDNTPIRAIADVLSGASNARLGARIGRAVAPSGPKLDLGITPTDVMRGVIGGTPFGGLLAPVIPSNQFAGGGVPANIRDAIPEFQTGGVMRGDGLAFLHDGETVTPAGAGHGHPILIDGRRVATALSRPLAWDRRLAGG